MGDIQPGERYFITHDIIVSGEEAFTRGEPVIVESVVPNEQSTQFQYVVISSTLLQRFQLQEADLTSEHEESSSVSEHADLADLIQAEIVRNQPSDGRAPQEEMHAAYDQLLANEEVANDKQEEVIGGLVIEPNLGPINTGDIRRVTIRILVEEGKLAFNGGEYVKLLEARTLEGDSTEYVAYSPMTRGTVWLPEDNLSNVFSPRSILEDVTLDDELAFTKGEPIVIEMKRRHPDRSDLKYWAFSQRLSGFCALHDDVIGSEVSVSDIEQGDVPKKLDIEPNLGPIKPRDKRRVTERITYKDKVAFNGGEYVNVIKGRTPKGGANEYLVYSQMIRKTVWLREDCLSNVLSPRIIMKNAYLDDELAFTKGEPIVIEMKRRHPDRSDLKYWAFSQRLSGFCALPDTWIGPESWVSTEEPSDGKTWREEAGKGLEKAIGKVGEMSLNRAIINGNARKVQSYLGHGVDVNKRLLLFDVGWWCGYAPIVGAGEYSQITKILIDHGADVNIRGETGRTPLYNVVGDASRLVGQETGGPLEVATILIDHGADVNVQDMYGRSPLHEALYFPEAKLLVDKGADVNTRDNAGSAPLHMAAERGNTGIAKLLLESGADVNPQNAEGETPLRFATANSHEDTVGLLRQYGGTF